MVPDLLMRLRKPVPPGAPELRAIEACLQGEYAPWPHLWEDHEDILRATAEAGCNHPIDTAFISPSVLLN